MSLSEIAVRLFGVILAGVGLLLLIGMAGIGPAHLPEWWAALLLGVLFLAGGVYIVRGGNFTP